MALTDEDKIFLDRITAYANEAMPDLDPQRTQISVQLQKLMPVLNTIAGETGVPVEDVFIRYMDLASEAFVATDEKVKKGLDDIAGGQIYLS